MNAEQTTLSNAELVKQLQAGNEAAFEALFLRHYERIYGVVFRLLGNTADAEDITQQIFLKLYYSPERIQIQNDEANIVGWLYRVAVNEGYNVLRSRKRRTGWHEKFARLWPFSHSAADPAQLAESEDTQAGVRQILAEMKPARPSCFC